MKRWLTAVLMLTIFIMAGCGSEKNEVVFVTTAIFSDPQFDGDIERNPAGTLTLTQGNTQSLFAGIDPVSGSEFRAFLDFPLTGTGGVPGNVAIESATLDIVINSIVPLSSTGIPILIDLVSFEPPVLLGSEFSLPFLATTAIIPPITAADVGKHVAVDVTPLMQTAQLQGFPNFQIRILQQPGTPPGLIEINDTTGVNEADFAPLLQVTYF